MEDTAVAASYSNRHKKQLIEKISRLSKTEHEEIFKIMRSKEESFTQNKNGVFFNLSNISDAIIKEIDMFVEFCLKNKKELDEYDKKLNECKISNNYTILQPRQSQTHEYQTDQKHDLNSILAVKNTVDTPKDNWLSLINEAKHAEKLSVFIETLQECQDKVIKKKSSTKFLNAKKKYSRRIVLDKKIENDLTSNLSSEPYIIGA